MINANPYRWRNVASIHARTSLYCRSNRLWQSLSATIAGVLPIFAVLLLLHEGEQSVLYSMVLLYHARFDSRSRTRCKTPSYSSFQQVQKHLLQRILVEHKTYCRNIPLININTVLLVIQYGGRYWFTSGMTSLWKPSIGSHSRTLLKLELLQDNNAGFCWTNWLENTLQLSV